MAEIITPGSAKGHTTLQNANESHGSYIFQIVGDTFCVGFPTAGDGLRAAMAAQCSLQAKAWGEKPMRMCMGLHAGAAEARAGVYLKETL